MSTITTVPPSSHLPPESPGFYRITVDEYERLAGLLDDPRVELINGYLVKKMSKKPPHIWAVGSVLDATTRVLPSGWSTRKEDPVRIPEFDEPEPDVAIVRGSRDDYRGRIPGPEDVALLVEVADTSLPMDQGQKRFAYARGRIPVYWIVNLNDRQVEVYSAPADDGYGSVEVFRPGDAVPVVIAGVEAGRIKVSDLLP
ncbi:MAG: Uma2 family endonuclease [Isosphaeraceae bacterium]